MRAKVVIVSRTKDRPLLLPRCLESVLAQTWRDWLHVIVNDGGNPAVVEKIVGRYTAQYQRRLKIIHNPVAVGMQNASNLAIQSTESEFIAIHDDDDTWKPVFLERCVTHLESLGPCAVEQGIVVQSAWVHEEIDPRGKVVELSRTDFFPFEHVSLFQLAAHNLFPPIAFLYRRKTHEVAGYFNQAFNELGDHDFNLRFTAHYEIAVLPEQLAGYHWRHQANGSSYGNTVTDGLASHRATKIKLQNHYLRQDLAAGKMGLGFLLNIAGTLEEQSEKTRLHQAKLDNFLRGTGKKLAYYDRLLTKIFKPWKSQILPVRLFSQIVDWTSTRPRANDSPESKTALSKTPLVDQIKSFSGAWEGDSASILYTDLARRHRSSHPVENAHDDVFWQMLGYELIGPLHHAFVSWVIEQAAKRGLKKLFFLARDGFHLVKVFNLLKEQNGFSLQADYLFASRRLFNLPCIETLDETSLAFLATPNPALRTGDFLSRIGLDPARYEALLKKHGFSGTRQPVTTKDGVFISDTVHQQMRQVMRDLEVPILELARSEREPLLAYLEQAGVMTEGAGIVDIGWQASSLLSLNRLIEFTGTPRKIPGFYFGTWSFASQTVNAGYPLESFFMHLGQPMHRAKILAESVELVESFFSAPHPTVIGLMQNKGIWEPVYGQPEIDPAMQMKLQIAIDAALVFVKDASAVCPKTAPLAPPFGYLETVLERLLKHPRRDEAEVLGRLSLRNSFGGAGPLRRVAVLPPPWKRVAQRRGLQDAYDHCYWKQGFMAQLGARQQKQIKT